MRALCSSTIPLRAQSLALLLEQQRMSEMMDVYQGDLLWSILGTLHSLVGSKLRAPSYSTLIQEIQNENSPKNKVITNNEVKKSIENTFRRYLKSND